MPLIAIASNNPVKIQATLNGFSRMFPDLKFSINPVNASSNVSSQPFGEETLQGAINRAQGARLILPNADFWVGIEGGVEMHSGEMTAFAWIVIVSPTHTGKGRTGTFFLPQRVSELILQGKELGDADDIVFNKQNSKQENGAIGILTGDVLDRTKLYEMAVILALVPFKNPLLYPGILEP